MSFSYTYLFTGICPYCQLNVHFSKYRMRKVTVSSDHALGEELDPISLSESTSPSDFPNEVSIVECDNCNKRLVIIFEMETISEENRVFKVKTTYPLISKIAMPDGVSQRIWDDYVESLTCLGANAPRGAVVLLRRATQSLMKELGADPKNKLYAQIKELENKGVITEGLSKLATELRIWGNFGAHPDDDLLDEVTIDDAKEMRYIFDLLLNYTVIQNAQVKEIQEKREKKTR